MVNVTDTQATELFTAIDENAAEALQGGKKLGTLINLVFIGGIVNTRNGALVNWALNGPTDPTPKPTGWESFPFPSMMP